MIDEELINALSQVINSVIGDWTRMEPQRRANFEINGEVLPKAIARTILMQNILDINPKKAILVVMDQGIGNMVMLTPTLRALRELYPKTNIDVLCQSPADQVIRGWDIINQVKNTIDQTDVGKYDVVLFSFWSQYYKKIYGELFNKITKRTYSVDVFDNFDIHEAQYNLDLAHICGYKKDLPETFCMTDDSVLDEHNLLEHKNLVALSDTTLNLPEWQIKRYPHYVPLSQKLIEQGYKVVLIGGKVEEENLKNQNFPEEVITSLLGRTSIPQSASVLKQCQFVICNDSSISHVAAAVGTKTFVFFGPTKLSKNRPLGKSVIPITTQKDCSPCQYTKRFGNCKPTDCLGTIKPEEVINMINMPSFVNNQIILVGVFSGEILRTESIAEKYLTKKGYKVERFPYREIAKNIGPEAMTVKLVKRIVETNPCMVFICGGQQIVPRILSKYKNIVKSKVLMWYLDQRGGVESWMVELGRQCDAIFWSTGDRRMLFELSCATKTPTYFMHSTADGDLAQNLNITDKDKKRFLQDIVYVGTYYPETTKTRLIDDLITKGINVKIFGPPGWPKNYNYLGGPILGEEAYKCFNLAKINISTNYHNDIRGSFSDRLFHIAAAGGFHLTQYVPGMEDIFENGKHLVWFNDSDEVLEKINYYFSLEHENERKEIAKNGQKLFFDKFGYDKVINEMCRLTLEGGRYENIFISRQNLPKISLLMPLFGQTVGKFYNETELELEKFFNVNYNVSSSDDEFAITMDHSTCVRDFRGVSGIGVPVIPLVLDLPMWRLNDEHFGPALREYINIIRNAPCAIGLSESTCEDIKKYCQQDKVTPWFIGMDITVEDESKYDNIQPENQILFISRFVERKYPLDIIKALKLLKDKTVKTITLVFITEGGDQNLINECGLFAKQNLIPILFKYIHRDDIVSKIKEIKKSICLVSASTFEGFGISPGEALYCKRPCIITDIPTHREIYQDKAIYFEPRNITQLTEKLEMIIGNPELQKEYGDKGHEYIVNRFTPKHSALLFKEKIYPFIKEHL